MFDKENLSGKTLSQLKVIARECGVVPIGDKRKWDAWWDALNALLPRQVQPIEPIEPIEIQAQEPIEKSIDADRPQEPIEKSIDADRPQEPIEFLDADRPQEPIEFLDLDAALAEIARLRTQNQELLTKIRSQTETICSAKDITPVQRCSFIRVLRLARAACLDVTKSITGGWVLSFGSRSRTFKTLYEIWRLLVPGEWILSDLFHPPEKVPIPSPDAFSHNRVVEWFAALRKVGLETEPLEAAQSRRSVGRFAAIPFCDDDLIDSYALGFGSVESSVRSPPGGGDAMQ